MSIKFKTAYAGHEPAITPSGEKIELTYGYDINKKGQKVLVVNGEEDVYEKIQEHLEETKIENILSRAAAGDMSVFRPEGMYADLTEAPSNLIEARRMMQNLENLWSTIPQEIKNKYNNDVETFIGASNTKTWLEDMGMFEKSTETHHHIGDQQAKDTHKVEKGEE